MIHIQAAMMMPEFDPSKMDPKVLMELSRMVQQLPPEKVSKMQSLMHNMMAGFDVSKEMEEFERTLPPGFREKIVGLMGGQMGAMSGAFTGGPAAPTIQTTGGTIEAEAVAPTAADMNLREARMTILRAVADGRMNPDDAERLLFTA